MPIQEHVVIGDNANHTITKLIHPIDHPVTKSCRRVDEDTKRELLILLYLRQKHNEEVSTVSLRSKRRGAK
jgi:hypothetical protein